MRTARLWYAAWVVVAGAAAIAACSGSDNVQNAAQPTFLGPSEDAATTSPSTGNPGSANVPAAGANQGPSSGSTGANGGGPSTPAASGSTTAVPPSEGGVSTPAGDASATAPGDASSSNGGGSNDAAAATMSASSVPCPTTACAMTCCRAAAFGRPATFSCVAGACRAGETQVCVTNADCPPGDRCALGAGARPDAGTTGTCVTTAGFGGPVDAGRG